MRSSYYFYGCVQWCGGWDLNPRTPTGQPPQRMLILASEDIIEWEKFKEWVFKEYRHFTALDRLRYAKKYAYCIIKGNLTDLKMLNDGTRLHVLKALTALAKFLGIYENFRTLVKNYGLKCTDRNTDQVIINRLLKVVDSNEIFEWVRQVKERIPELSDFIDLMLATGLRLIEAIEGYNLIIKLSNEGKLRQYYNEDREVLEHFRFKEIFIRNSKKAFISFVPKDLVHRIAKNQILDYDKVRKVVEWRIKKLRFGDLREFHGSTMTKYLRQPEIDFLHGRISASVFMQNYFNPNWIKDLKRRAFRGIEKIMNQVQCENVSKTK